jgi:hypothetical protein
MSPTPLLATVQTLSDLQKTTGFNYDPKPLLVLLDTPEFRAWHEKLPSADQENLLLALGCFAQYRTATTGTYYNDPAAVYLIGGQLHKPVTKDIDLLAVMHRSPDAAINPYRWQAVLNKTFKYETPDAFRAVLATHKYYKPLLPDRFVIPLERFPGRPIDFVVQTSISPDRFEKLDDEPRLLICTINPRR